MNLANVLSRLQQQTRLSPLVTDANLVSWLGQAIRKVCRDSQWLEAWTIIVCKDDVASYLLPENHQVTTSVYYDEVKLQTCTSFDSQLVSPSTPVYYYEDDWQDQASRATVCEFTTHYALNELWLLQLMRGQNNYGRKTITLLSAPTTDGDAPTQGSPQQGWLSGSFTDDTVVFVGSSLVTTYAASTDNNLMIFYKCYDSVPESSTDTMSWNDGMAVLYICQTLSLALSTEDDEYDRYRSWLYGYLADSSATMLRNMAINRSAV